MQHTTLWYSNFQISDPTKSVIKDQVVIDDKIITHTVEKWSLNKQTAEWSLWRYSFNAGLITFI